MINGAKLCGIGFGGGGQGGIAVAASAGRSSDRGERLHPRAAGGLAASRNDGPLARNGAGSNACVLHDVSLFEIGSIYIQLYLKNIEVYVNTNLIKY